MSSTCKEHFSKGHGAGYKKTSRLHNGKQRSVLYHRWICLKAAGIDYWDVPAGLVVRHTCNNPRCINLEHLVIGTQVENMADKREAGTHIEGDRHAATKIPDSAIASIRDGSVSVKDAAAMYGCSVRHIRMIKAGTRR